MPGLRELTDFSQFATDAELASAIAGLSSVYQAILSSGVNIKTVENQSLVGSGNVLINALPLAGGTLTGILSIIAGTQSAPGLALAGSPGVGIFLESLTEGVNLIANGNRILQARHDTVRFYRAIVPSADNSLTIGNQSARPSQVHAVGLYTSLGSVNSPSLLFRDNAGTLVGGAYAATGLVGFVVGGVSQVTFGSGLTIQTGLFRKPTYTVGTLPSAAANAGAEATVASKPVYSDGINWRYVTDNTIVV